MYYGAWRLNFASEMELFACLIKNADLLLRIVSTAIYRLRIDWTI